MIGYCHSYDWEPNIRFSNLSDYQGRLDELNKTLESDPQNLTALEYLRTVYRMMEGTAYNLHDTYNYNKYSNAESEIGDRITEVLEAQETASYQKSLGVSEKELNDNINTTKNLAYEDPLNATRWQDLSNAYNDMAEYHSKDDSFSMYFALKMDADNAVQTANYVKEGATYYEAGDFSLYIINASKTMKEKSESDIELKRLQYARDRASEAIATDMNRTSTEAPSAWADLSHDYIALSDAIVSLDNFNKSLNDNTSINDTAYYSCREMALKCFNKAIETSGSRPKSEYWLNSGRIYNALENQSSAIKCFDKGIAEAVKEHNNETLIRCLYLKAKDMKGTDLSQTAKLYEEILKIDSYDPRIWKELSKIYKELGRYTDASDANDAAEFFKHESRSLLPHLPDISL